MSCVILLISESLQHENNFFMPHQALATDLPPMYMVSELMDTLKSRLKHHGDLVSVFFPNILDFGARVLPAASFLPAFLKGLFVSSATSAFVCCICRVFFIKLFDCILPCHSSHGAADCGVG